MGSRIRGGRLKGASRGPLGLAVEATSNVANEGRPLKETSCVISSEQSCTGMCFYDSCAVFSCPNPLTAVVRLKSPQTPKKARSKSRHKQPTNHKSKAHRSESASHRLDPVALHSPPLLRVRATMSAHAQECKRFSYTKLKELGRGTFGVVFLVARTASGECFVMKEVSLRGMPSGEIRNTKNEVRVLQRLHHDHVISYVDSFVVEGRDPKLCIIMEWASGGDLAGLISRRKKLGARFSEAEQRVIATCLTTLNKARVSSGPFLA